jgi:hypothetical protein
MAALTVFVGDGDRVLYFGAARLTSGTITPSRGTVIEQRTGDTNAASVCSSEALSGHVGPLQVTMTPNVSTGQVAALVAVSG